MSKERSLGVVIGRFQIHELHEGHVSLIDRVNQLHRDLLILVGYNTVRFNTDDPFPVGMRIQMLQSRYPDAIIMPLMDSPISHEEWSRRVDESIGKVNQAEPAILYGSRDSFIPKYSGIFPTCEIEPIPHCSATQIREQVTAEMLDDPVYRLGWLAAIKGQFTITDPTVDVAIHTSDWSMVLMGRRGEDSPLRFFGGFVDPEDDSYEDAAMRERAEEALGITVAKPAYIGSKRINDPRYGRGPYGIMTTFFALAYKGGRPAAGDDMGLTEWRVFDEDLREQVAIEHQPLLDLLLHYRKQQLAQ